MIVLRFICPLFISGKKFHVLSRIVFVKKRSRDQLIVAKGLFNAVLNIQYGI